MVLKMKISVATYQTDSISCDDGLIVPVCKAEATIHWNSGKTKQFTLESVNRNAALIATITDLLTFLCIESVTDDCYISVDDLPPIDTDLPDIDISSQLAKTIDMFTNQYTVGDIKLIVCKNI
jgi:hypothetical protein